MLTFIILYAIFGGIVRSIVVGLILSSNAIYSILAVCIFITIALMFLPSARHWGTIGLIAVVLGYVVFDVISSYPIEVMQLISFVLSLAVTLPIKRAMWRFVRYDAVQAANGGTYYLTSPWMRWLVRLI